MYVKIGVPQGSILDPTFYNLHESLRGLNSMAGADMSSIRLYFSGNEGMQSVTDRLDRKFCTTVTNIYDSSYKMDM